MLIAIGKVAEMFGVTTQTIRNWSKCGILTEVRTLGGHRRFDKEQVEMLSGKEKQEQEKLTIVYSRVSSHDQKDDLVRQSEELQAYCQQENITNVKVIEDLGSGVNYKKKGLRELIASVVLGKVKRIVISYKDRLVRFGSELVEEICRLMDVEIVTLHAQESKDFEQMLVEDVLMIMTVYSSKIYGRRSHQKNKVSMCG